MQHPFIKSRLFSSLAILPLVVGFQGWLVAHRPALDLSAAQTQVHYAPVRLDTTEHGPSSAGAWTITVDDPRFGGLSGLAVERGRLVALSDSGFLFMLDPPGGGGRATVRALPAVAGNPRFKPGRDSEALAADPLGRGWWVAFEGAHSLMLYDFAFGALRRRIPLARYGFGRNRGIEALLPRGRILVAIPEASGISDAAPMPGGGAAMLRRWFGFRGFGAAVEVRGKSVSLPVAWLDNPEGIAAAPLLDGGTRLWIVTDNDARRWRRTLLMAVDIPPQ